MSSKPILCELSYILLKSLVFLGGVSRVVEDKAKSVFDEEGVLIGNDMIGSSF